MICESKIFVFVEYAVVSFSNLTLGLGAKVIEEWNKLVHLPGVIVVRQGEWSIGDSDLIKYGCTEPFSGEQLFDSWVSGFAIRAEEVVENLN